MAYTKYFLFWLETSLIFQIIEPVSLEMSGDTICRNNYIYDQVECFLEYQF